MEGAKIGLEAELGRTMTDKLKESQSLLHRAQAAEERVMAAEGELSKTNASLVASKGASAMQGEFKKALSLDS